jgi:hypothetical protein
MYVPGEAQRNAAQNGNLDSAPQNLAARSNPTAQVWQFLPGLSIQVLSAE